MMATVLCFAVLLVGPDGHSTSGYVCPFALCSAVLCCAVPPCPGALVREKERGS